MILPAIPNLPLNLLVAILFYLHVKRRTATDRWRAAKIRIPTQDKSPKRKQVEVVSTMNSDLNPYAPARPVSETANSVVGELGPVKTPLSVSKLIVRWTLICGISAAPSFFFGYAVSRHQVAAMLMGIVCFIAIYVFADHSTRNWPIRKQSIVRRVLVFCYATRIIVSILFPIGAVIDMCAGVITFTILDAEALLRQPPSDEPGAMTFTTAFTVTIVQGIVLNVILAVWGLLAFAVLWLCQFAVGGRNAVEGESQRSSI